MSIFASDLMADQTVDCVFMNKAIVLDEYGGYSESWTDGAPFEAVITENNSTEAIAAGLQFKTTFYGVKVARNVPLEYLSVFKRLKDGKTFRIRNADGMNSPNTSVLDMKQLQAEEWRP